MFFKLRFLEKIPFGTAFIFLESFASSASSASSPSFLDDMPAAVRLFSGLLLFLLSWVSLSVSAGQQVMITGNTGHSTGPHLHFQINVNSPDGIYGTAGLNDSFDPSSCDFFNVISKWEESVRSKNRKNLGLISKVLKFFRESYFG